MDYGDKLLNDMARLIGLFAPHCRDRSTLDELGRMVGKRQTWSKAHDLFDRIRDKTLAAERSGDRILDCQYLFEEICAKTLYNLSGASAPFDADSPYWIIPIALEFARSAGVSDDEVMRIVAPVA